MRIRRAFVFLGKNYKMKRHPYILLFSISIFLFSSCQNSQTENRGTKSDANIEANDSIQMEKKLTERAAPIYAKYMVTLTTLQKKWEMTDGDKMLQEEFLRIEQSEIKKLGISVRTADEAENAFVSKISILQEAMKLKAKAEASKELAEEKYQQAYTLEQNSKHLQDKNKP